MVFLWGSSSLSGANLSQIDKIEVPEIPTRKSKKCKDLPKLSDFLGLGDEKLICFKDVPIILFSIYFLEKLFSNRFRMLFPFFEKTIENFVFENYFRKNISKVRTSGRSDVWTFGRHHGLYNEILIQSSV